MSPQLNTLLKVLEGKNPSVSLLEEKLLNALGDSQAISQFISDLYNEMHFTKDFHDIRIPFYHFFLSVAYYEQGEHKKAKDELADSILGFRTQDLNLNEAMGEYIFGIIHYKSKKTERAQRANNTASAILQELIKQCEIKRSYQRAKIYKRHLSRVSALNRMINSQLAFDSIEEKNISSVTPTRQDDYLFIQWLPTYESVRAGKEGISWASPSPHNGTTIYMIELESAQYKVFSVQSSKKSKDHQITLARENTYGWAKVKGKSMNASKPVPIEEGDYVLFSSIWEENQDAIVIAGFMLSGQGTSMMVKKYLANERTLNSETTDLANLEEDYSPIQLTGMHKILGTVMAVAKTV